MTVGRDSVEPSFDFDSTLTGLTQFHPVKVHQIRNPQSPTHLLQRYSFVQIQPNKGQ